MKLHRYSRPMAAMAAALVLGLAVFTVQQAYAVATVPNATRITYAVAAGASSPSWSIPLANQPVHIMLAQTDNGYRTVAHGTFSYSSVGGGTTLMTWNGINSNQTSGLNGGGDSSLSSGWTSVGSTTLLDHGFLTSSRLVSVLDGSGNATRFSIKNDGGSTHTTVVVMIW